ncbi:VOC family protein [Mariniluteicoccus endophyticus]
MAHYKDLCLDTTDQRASVAFWSAALGLTHRAGHPWGEPQVLVHADDPRLNLWVNEVPEPKEHKARVHLDVHTAAVADLEALGARSLDDSHGWTVMEAPDGLELCAFVRHDVPAQRLYELGVDAADPEAQARWWADRLGLTAGTEDGVPWWWVEGDGLPYDSIVFAPVPETKQVKNRIHWDVSGSVEEFTSAGAVIISREGAWTVLADPEGNEFCVFGED